MEHSHKLTEITVLNSQCVGERTDYF